MTIRLVFLLLVAQACAGEPSAATFPSRLVVLGVDGMDLALTRQYLDDGRLPHLQALARQGAFVPLATSTPPQSPVAWSDFITGQTSAAHGIYDFVHRNPATLAPYLSTSGPGPAPPAITMFGRRLPLGPAQMSLLREGQPFWARLAAAGVPATVLKIPAHFPPTGDGGARTLAGMGTPDLLGTYGTFQLFTDDPALVGRSLAGGIVHPVRFTAGTARAALSGPANPLRVDGRPLTSPLLISARVDRRAALLRLEGPAGTEARLLRAGQWSGWIPVAFDAGLMAGRLAGMVRVYLKSLTPHLVLYVSPINIDPTEPAMPISSPEGWASTLAARVGRFFTQGMPEETKALEAGVLSDDEFLAQVDLVFEEERALLRDQLAQFRGGLLFHYFSVVDQMSHMFFRSLDPQAPPAVRRHREVLPRLYARIDEVVGEIRDKLGAKTPIIVMSDHGFAPYRFKVNLNTWLMREGYLVLRGGADGASGPLGHIDWNQTQAYALGLNQIFVNMRGREADGVVAPEAADRLLHRLARRLESWLDPLNGSQVVARTFRPPAGTHPGRRPDLIVGFARGYRSSDESATGLPEPEPIRPNTDRWSGDHCLDPALVPGVLFSWRKLTRDRAALIDLAPTILQHFQVDPDPEGEGHSLTANEPNEGGAR